MFAVIILFCVLSFLFSVSASAKIPSKYKLSAKTKQLVTVKYTGSSRGRLTYFEKKRGKWKKVFSCKAYLGSGGIGKKKEGDKKTPTGLYSLGRAFGICKNPGTKMPYTRVNCYHYWCGDSGSKYYNQLVRTDKVKHKCHGEHLIQYKKVYDYGIFIGYNKAGKAGKGSAIFLHCSGGRSTAGCVAISKTNMKKLLKRLKPEAKPRILIDKWK